MQVTTKAQQINSFTKINIVSYRVESITVGKDKLDVSHKLLYTLIMVEMLLVQSTPYRSEVHRRHNDLVIVRDLAHTHTHTTAGLYIKIIFYT